MYERHEQCTGHVAAPASRVFARLDDQTLLSAHMSKRSWRMAWGKLETHLDDKRGRAVGSRIALDGRVLGIRLSLVETVIERDPPSRKTWETLGEPQLLVIGPYRMGFVLRGGGGGGASDLTVAIDYSLPARGVSRFLGRLFGRMYARWCVERMVADARTAFG